MAAEFARDQATDHLLTPKNAALVVIDYQPSQVQTVASIDHELLVDNIVSVARLAKTFDLPVVLSTVSSRTVRGRRSPSSRRSSPTARRSTGRRSTRGRTSTSTGQLRRRGAGS